MFARSSGRGSTSETTDLCEPNRRKVDARKVNESLYELKRPSGTPEIWEVNESLYELKRPSGTPEIELLFFHGLQPEDESDAHLRTWESEDGSSLWPQIWLAEEFPAARILCVAYDGSVRNSSRSSFDMYNIVENLITDFMQEKTGQTPNCPVVLIGHCFGGLVIKQLCLEANVRKHVGLESQRAKVGAFLDNVKGVFFYGTPHHGIPGLGEASELVINSQLLSYFKKLSEEASRLDFEFTQLRQFYATWLVWSLGEDLPVDRGLLRGFVAAPEGTARRGDHFNLLALDHRSICKPSSKNDKRFYFLTELLHIIARNSQVVLPIHKVHGLPTYPLDLERRALVVKEKLIGGGILGICGMGGIGKTTLAKQTFNMMSKDFEYTCFVDNAKGIPSHELEKWVLNQFHQNGKKSVQSSTQWSDLHIKKALIAMDDVDEDYQLTILPKLEHFAAGSCIIITSRNRQVFKYDKSCIVHEVDLLEEPDAKRLICWHAFGSQDVPEFLTNKVDAVVRKCEGLPLTLEVIGKYLQDHSTDVEVWIETLHRLTKAQPITGEEDDKVRASLRTSYDALPPEEQEMFREAALFFYEEPLDDALAAWNTATQTARTTWRNLVSRSLVKEINERVWVHESLRDLAHNISNEIMVSGTDDEANSALDLLNDKQVDATTKCLRLKYSYYFTKTRRSVQLASLAKLKGLKYIDLADVHSEGSGNGFTTKISFLRCHSSNMSKFEFSLNKMQNLAVLELSNFRMPDEFPDTMGKLTNLRILRLSKLEGFDHLPENFGNLSRLRRLEVWNLGSLTLPKSFGNLRALEHLVLNKICSLALPESLGDLSKLRSDDSAEWTGLQSLSISSEELHTLPASFCGLKSLQELKIHCPKLEMLPESLGELSLLKTFSSYYPHLEKLPDTFANLPHKVEPTLPSSCGNQGEENPIKGEQRSRDQESECRSDDAEDEASELKKTQRTSIAKRTGAAEVHNLSERKSGMAPTVMGMSHARMSHSGSPTIPHPSGMEASYDLFETIDKLGKVQCLSGTGIPKLNVFETPHSHQIHGKRPEFMEDFLVEVNNNIGESGYFVSKIWLFNLQEHEREEIMSVLQTTGYLEIYQTCNTVFYERMEGMVQVPATVCTPDNDVCVGAIKQVIASDDTGAFANIEQTSFNDEQQHDIALTSELEAGPKTDVKCLCRPQILAVSFTSTSPSQDRPSTSSSQGAQHVSRRSTRERGGDCYVIMPRLRKGRVVSVGVEKDISMPTIDYTETNSHQEVSVRLTVSAKITLTVCVRSDHDDQEVLVELLKIGGAVKMDESIYKKTNALVMKAMRTNLDVFSNGGEEISLQGDEDISSQRRRVLKVSRSWGDTHQSKRPEDLLWLELSGIHPTNSEPGSTTLELQCHVLNRLKEDHKESSNAALVLDFQGSPPVKLKGQIPADVDPDSFLELNLRFQAEISYRDPCTPRPSADKPYVGVMRVNKVVDFDCILEFRTQNVPF